MSSKGNDITTHNGEVPYILLSQSCFYCPNLITVAPKTRNKEICQSHLINRLHILPKLFSEMYFLFYPEAFDDVMKFENVEF